jgi:hypothetical protein
LGILSDSRRPTWYHQPTVQPIVGLGEDSMDQGLPAPEVLRCYFDESFDPHLPAMCLRWDGMGEPAPRDWRLPEGLSLRGLPPTRFGLHVHRSAEDCYTVQLLWDRTCLIWLSLTRREILACDLGTVLVALGTDLWYLLDQPIDPQPSPSPRAA